MSLENIENRGMPRGGIFPRKLENRQDDSQKQPVVPIRILKDGVEVSEEFKQKIELPRVSPRLKEDMLLSWIQKNLNILYKTS